jgi:hypothetical protein
VDDDELDGVATGGCEVSLGDGDCDGDADELEDELDPAEADELDDELDDELADELDDEEELADGEVEVDPPAELEEPLADVS